MTLASKNFWKVLLPMLAISACGPGGAPGFSATTSGQSPLGTRQLDALSDLSPNKMALCAPQSNGGVRCFAWARLNKNGTRFAASAPQGLGATDLQAAYAIPQGSTATIAIVDAQDYPSAESDLGVYRKQYGLPACTTANGCFKKINQNGQTSPLPDPDNCDGWNGEAALDLDMASAACPTCKILFVEANSESLDDLGTAVNAAVAAGATVVSNSYGYPESDTQDWDPTTSQALADQYFNHPGVGIFVSTGDSGYGVAFPSSSTYVTAVGGTNLQKASNARGWTESAWSDGGSGCSQYITSKPAYQQDTGCQARVVADVSAVADVDNSPVATYCGGAWTPVGGTSVSSPLVAGIYAAAGQGAAGPSLSYTETSAFFDVTSGTNGSCSPSYLCSAGPGYDGPTGNGTPNGAALAGAPAPSGPAGPTGPTSPSTGPTGPTSPSTGPTGPTNVPPPPASCAHDPCSKGPVLNPSCDPCVATICDIDSYCCGTKWDSQCVAEVTWFCGESCD